MLNTKLIAELIEKGEFSEIRESMEKSMSEGSQTFEMDIARLIAAGKITRDEGVTYADSPTNLLWRLQNDFAKSAAPVEEEPEDDGPSFTEITLDVKQG
jgi:twitching motility protein PilU